MSQKHIFVDGVATIQIRGGVARLGLGVLEEKQQDQIEMVETNTLVMPMEGFIRTFNAMRDVMAKLEKEGLIRKMEGQA